jgi:hypothetical protein
LFCKSETRYLRYIETEFRDAAILLGPGDPHSWRNKGCMRWIGSFTSLTFKPSDEWKQPVEELVMALKAVTQHESWLIYVKMLETVNPLCFDDFVEADMITKEDMHRLGISASDRLFNKLQKERKLRSFGMYPNHAETIGVFQQ